MEYEWDPAKAAANLRAALTGVLFVLVIVVLGLAGCGDSDSGLDEWTEDVALSDGSVVRVHRTRQVEVHSPIGGPTSAFQRAVSLQVVSDGRRTPPWRDAVVPMVLDFDAVSGEWVIIALLQDCSAYKRLGRLAELGRVEFRLRDGNWTLVPIDPAWFGVHSNLAMGAPRQVRRGIPHVDLEQKRVLNQSPPLPTSYLVVGPVPFTERECGPATSK